MGGAALLFALLDMVVAVVYDLLIPLLRAIVAAPVAFVRSSKSGRRTIEALTLWPHEERYVWETDAERVDHVLEEIALGLGQGTFVQPAEAVFLGRQT
jgi:hypothetical protein